MNKVPVGVFGAGGYSGQELLKLLVRHPRVTVAFAASDQLAGSTLAGIQLEKTQRCLEVSAAVSLAFLATPNEASLTLAPTLRKQGVRVIDLSGAFRLKDLRQYPTYYNIENPHSALVAEAVYGLAEWSQVQGATMVANPGCYATAVTMSLAPLVKARLIDTRDMVVTAASGVSGAGRNVIAEYGFMEVDGDFRAYSTLNHRHRPEIVQFLQSLTTESVDLTFVPHLLPTKRGILSTAVVKLAPGVAPTAVGEALAQAYREQPLVEVMKRAEDVRIQTTWCTPKCAIGATVAGGRAVVTASLDNLLKGAASQAVQNMNAMLDFSPTAGLD